MSDDEARAAADLAWSKKVGSIAVSTCLAAGIITQEQFDRCNEIVAEEIYIRLVFGDRPTP